MIPKEFMIGLARESGKIAMKYFDQEKKVRYKDDNSVVTIADMEVTEYLISEIQREYPDHSIISEELDQVKGKSEFRWIIDPIDGTHNYSKNNPIFSISIAFADEKEVLMGVVYLPYLDELFFAELGKGASLNGNNIEMSKVSDLGNADIFVGKGPESAIQRTVPLIQNLLEKAYRVKDYGSCSVELCFVAAGRVDGLVRLNQKVWDFAAGKLIIEESGGVFTGTKGEKVDLKTSDIVVSNSILHEKILKEIK